MLARQGLLLSLWLRSCVLLTLVASTWTARVKVPKLAQPDYSVYHTKWVLTAVSASCSSQTAMRSCARIACALSSGEPG